MEPTSTKELREWLLKASIPPALVDQLLGVLAKEWVHDVPTLLKTLPALERALPAPKALPT